MYVEKGLFDKFKIKLLYEVFNNHFKEIMHMVFGHAKVCVKSYFHTFLRKSLELSFKIGPLERLSHMEA